MAGQSGEERVPPAVLAPESGKSIMKTLSNCSGAHKIISSKEIIAINDGQDCVISIGVVVCVSESD